MVNRVIWGYSCDSSTCHFTLKLLSVRLPTAFGEVHLLGNHPPFPSDVSPNWGVMGDKADERMEPVRQDTKFGRKVVDDVTGITTAAC